MRNRTGITLLLLASACARVVAPSGGPEDRDPPEIIGVIPEPGPTDTIPGLMVIEYSERISGEENMVETYPGGAEIHISGSSIEILPVEHMEVFTVTVSGQLKDAHGNTTGDPVTLVWNSIPENMFSALAASVSRTGGGSVTESARCDFYLLPDTASPLLTQYPDSSGAFTVGWLPEGDYMLLCYEDNDRSRSWDPEREAGVRSDVSLTSGDTASVSLAMTIVDSIGPVISAVEVLDGWHLELQWNEQVTSPDPDEDYVTITGPDSVPLMIYGLRSAAGRSSTGRITVYTGAMRDTMYTIRVQGIEDLSGNPSLPDSLEFWAIDSMPSFDFSIQSSYPEDGASDVPPGGPYIISFTDWVDLEAIDSLYTVTRIFDNVQVRGSMVRTSPVAFSFFPDEELLGEKQYRIDLDSGLVSLQGDTLGGKSWTFKPAWSDLPGSVSGVLTGTSAQVIRVVAASAGGGDDRFTAEFAGGEFHLENLPGGRYTVSCFVDWNGNLIWDPGEPYGAWPGVIEVFPGMDTSNVDIQVVP